MHPLVSLPAALRAEPFTLKGAQPYGLTARMLRGRRFRRLSKTVYVFSDVPLTHSLRCRAACLAAPHAVLSHASAALAHGLPLGVQEPEPLRPHVTTAAGRCPTDRIGWTNHHEDVPRWQVVQTRLGPATSVARTFVDRAAELDIEDLVALGDVILRRELAGVGELADLVAWAYGRRGVVQARRALPLLNRRSASPMESRTRVVLVVDGLPEPEVNAHIYDELGCWLACCDLVYRAARLIIEFDGGGHLTEGQRRSDLQRRNLLTLAGWTVLYVTADDLLKRPAEFVAQVRHQLAQAR